MEDFTELIIHAHNLDDLEKLLGEYHESMLKRHSYEVCVQIYRQQDLPDIQEWLYQAHLAKGLGTYTFCGKPTLEVIGNLEFAVKFLTEPPQRPRRVFIWDNMPDMLTDEELSEYLGLSPATIKSKRSRGELPKRTDLGRTSKRQLMDLAEKSPWRQTTPADRKANATQEKIASYRKGRNK